MAGDQIEIQLPKTKYAEKSAFTATAYFRTRSTGAAATPTTVDYRVDNLSVEIERTGWTSVTPGTTASISVTASDNTIQGGISWTMPRWETVQLTVSIDRGLDTEVNGAKQWRVVNLYGVS